MSLPRHRRFELLELLSAHHEDAFDRLYKWVQERCQRAGGSDGAAGADGAAAPPQPLLDCADANDMLDDGEGVGGALRTAIGVLRARPAFYVHCQECVGAARRALTARRFVAALTGMRGGSDSFAGAYGTPRAIELQVRRAAQSYESPRRDSA